MANDVELTENERKTVVDGLITNSEGEGCCWQEGDREVLNAMSDVTLAKLTKQQELAMNAGVPEELQKDSNEDVSVEEEKTKKNTAQADGKVAPLGELDPRQMRNQRVEAQEQVKTPVNNGLSDQDRKDLAFARRYRMDMRQRQIGTIVANARSKFTAKELTAMDDGMLQNLAHLATQEVIDETMPSYFGAQGAGLAANASGEEEEPLPIPVINYKELAASNR